MNKRTRLAPTLALCIAMTNLAVSAGLTHAAFDVWEIAEVLSNTDGTIQFIELQNNTPASDGGLLLGRTFTTNSNAFTYPVGLVGDTAHKMFLMVTSGFAVLPGAPQPDYIIPDSFFNPNGDTLTFVSGTRPYRTLSFGPGALPHDGVLSLNQNLATGALTTAVNSPTNFAGFSGTITVPVKDPIPQPIEKGPITVELQQVALGLAAPIHLTHAGDGTNRLFVVDQAGQIRIIRKGMLLPKPFLDVSDRLVRLGILGTFDENDYDERGLLGLAFHPDYGNPVKPGYHKIYTYTSEPSNGLADFTVPMPPGRAFNHQSVIAEWTVDPGDPNRIDPSTRRELMRVDQPQFNHNAGMLAFGPDGYLYVAFGDGGAANDSAPGHSPKGNGQDLTVVLGKILRLDVDGHNSKNGRYSVPVDNPFVGDANIVSEIYAYGLRNPFRFSFDRPTGRLIVADVGQNKVEEIDLVTAGGDLGWNLKEGTFRFDPATGTVSNNLAGLPAGLIDPVAQYDHDEGISVIGGYVYRGLQIPELLGMYVFGDFSRSFSKPGGRLFFADLQSGEIKELVIGLDDRNLGLFVKGFGQDAAGELYVLASGALGPFGARGQVLRIGRAECTPGQDHVMPGDLNRDCKVNALDFAIMAQYWLECAPGPQTNCE